MDITQLTSSDLQQIIKLLQEKEELESQIAEINRRLSGFGGEASTPVKRGPQRRAGVSTAAPSSARPTPKAGKAKSGRGELKSKVIAILQSAGKEGIGVGDLAKRLGTTYGNIYAFFQSTGKRISEIQKVGPGKFGWAG